MPNTRKMNAWKTRFGKMVEKAGARAARLQDTHEGINAQEVVLGDLLKKETAETARLEDMFRKARGEMSRQRGAGSGGRAEGGAEERGEDVGAFRPREQVINEMYEQWIRIAKLLREGAVEILLLKSMCKEAHGQITQMKGINANIIEWIARGEAMGMLSSEQKAKLAGVFKAANDNLDQISDVIKSADMSGEAWEASMIKTASFIMKIGRWLGRYKVPSS